MSIYLLKKTHKITGLKYLCKTIREDWHKYSGSGKYWKRHIKVHGRDIDTDLLKECQTAEELREWGLYYSELWNVVESDEWANMRPEDGDGGGPGNSSEVALECMNRPEVLQKIKEVQNKPEVRAKRSGSKHGLYDHTIYTFRHVSGIVEICTQHYLRTKYNLNRSHVGRLIAGTRKNHQGWSIDNQ